MPRIALFRNVVCYAMGFTWWVYMVVLCCVVLCSIVSLCFILLCCVVSSHVESCFIVLLFYIIVLYCVVSCSIVNVKLVSVVLLCCNVSNRVVSSCGVLFRVVYCCDLLCLWYVVLCCFCSAVLCYSWLSCPVQRCAVSNTLTTCPVANNENSSSLRAGVDFHETFVIVRLSISGTYGSSRRWTIFGQWTNTFRLSIFHLTFTKQLTLHSRASIYNISSTYLRYIRTET